MVNPFKHTANVVGSLYTSASQSDCAPGPAAVGVTLLMPVVIPFSFIHALFKKGNR